MGDLEDSSAVSQRLRACGAAVRGTLEVILAVQPHVCWEHIAHDDQPDLTAPNKQFEPPPQQQ